MIFKIFELTKSIWYKGLVKKKKTANNMIYESVVCVVSRR